MSSTGRRPLLSEPGDRYARLAPVMVALTFLTGVVDAVSYLRLGHVFVANMTGNVVFLGFGIAGAHGLSVLSSLIALAAFLLGAHFGGKISGSLGDRRWALLRATAGLQASLIGASLVVSLLANPARDGGRYPITALLAIAMGLQNAAAQELAVPELTTTVLTKTLTGLATDPGAVRHLRARRVLAVAAMLLGALVGGLLALRVSVPAALGLALALAASVAALAHHRLREAPRLT